MPVPAVQAALIIKPALMIGLALGIYEAIVLHRDVQIPQHRFGHMLHALIFAVVACFATFNVPFVLSVIPQLQTVPLIKNVLIFRLVIGIIAAIKIHAVSQVLQGSGMSSAGLGETWFHSIFIGLLVAVSPYAFPLLAPLLPAWAK